MECGFGRWGSVRGDSRVAGISSSLEGGAVLEGLLGLLKSALYWEAG